MLVVLPRCNIVVVIHTGLLFPDCNCDIRGTENGSVECDATGQCQCKQYVSGLRCNTCQSGFFGLDANNTDGNDGLDSLLLARTQSIKNLKC